MMVYEEDGAGACDVFLRKSGLETDGAFKACLQALLNAIPRARVKGKFVRPFVFRLSSFIRHRGIISVNQSNRGSRSWTN
jgi:hypothetical protein